MKRYLFSSVSAAMFAFLIGCSGFDRTQILVHPDATAPSAVFDVALTNLFLYPDTGTTVSRDVKRDSLHLLVGLPESWEVAGASMAVAADMNSEAMLALQGGAIDAQGIAALIQQYLSQAVEVPSDGGLAAALSGKTVKAHGRLISEADISVNADEVKQWKGFSAPVNIVLDKGGKPDTVIPLDSAIAFATESGLMPDSIAAEVTQLRSNPILGSLVPDTVGIKVVPIILFLKIKAGDREGTETLYYFTKTDSMNPAPSTAVTLLGTYAAGLADIEKGDMTYTSINVINGARVIAGRSPFDASAMKTVVDRSTGSVRIDLGNLDPQQAFIEIYSLQGSLVRTLMPMSSARSVVWNGADERGSRVGNGSYFIRIAGSGGSAVRSVQLVR